MLYWSLGILPFKDLFWSRTDEPGNTWRGQELDPELQVLVSALTGGPVGIGDAIGMANRTRIRQVCRMDGVLLKPDRPAYQLDSTFTAAFRTRSDQVEGLAHVWGTTASIPGFRSQKDSKWWLILAANLTSPYNIIMSDLGPFA